MGNVPVGAIVLVNFPFADLKGYKKRPAVVVAQGSLDTVVLCQITSRQLPDAPAVPITKKDFAKGSLPITSYVRPDKLFTVDADMAKRDQVGILGHRKVELIKASLRELFA